MPHLPHPQILPYIPGRLLLAIHRDICRLRGSRFGCPNPGAPYTTIRPLSYLLHYHAQVLREFTARGYRYAQGWANPVYRGRRIAAWEAVEGVLMASPYPEHTQEYLKASTALIEAKITKGKFGQEDRIRWTSKDF